jgi:hypothetical protein
MVGVLCLVEHSFHLCEVFGRVRLIDPSARVVAPDAALEAELEALGALTVASPTT